MRAICVFWLLLVAGQPAQGGELLRLRQAPSCLGMCDASGAVVVNSNRFLVANDEDNILRVYDARVGGPPVQQFNLQAFLEPDRESPEADLEAGARVGNRVYWISSHGRNKNGKRRANRCRFFAVDISVNADLVTLTPVGRPCKTLLQSLLHEPGLRQFELDRAAKRTPKERDALDIEGLAPAPGGALLIGFRNPIPGGKALLVPLQNPDELLQGRPARFGAAVQLDLGGLGIRDMALWGQQYLIIAGAYDGAPQFALFRWAGPGNAPQKIPSDALTHFNPEALLVYELEPSGRIQILSDDGSRDVEGTPCKDLKNPLQRVFRSFFLDGD